MEKNQLMAAMTMVKQTLAERENQLAEAEAEQVHITEPCLIMDRQDVSDHITRLKEKIRCLQMEIMEYHETINENI